jgi:2-keto-myo-inositol isomerase
MGFEWAAVRTLAEAMRVHPGPVVVDTFHWALGDGDLEALRGCDPSRIAVVHVNDAPSRDLARLGDADRLLPGAGVLDLRDFYATLRAIGYAGVYSVEVFTPVSAEAAYAAMARLAA